MGATDTGLPGPSLVRPHFAVTQEWAGNNFPDLASRLGAGLLTPPPSRAGLRRGSHPAPQAARAALARPADRAARSPGTRRVAVVCLTEGLRPQVRLGDLRSARWQGRETLPQALTAAENLGKLFPPHSSVAR